MTTCEFCGGDGWVRVDTPDGNGAMARCRCRKIQKQQAASGTALTWEAASAAVGALCEVLEFAPKSAMAQSIITSGLMAMCSTEEQVKWLINEAGMRFTKWGECGLPVLRQILCSKYRPKDGIDYSYTPAFPDGIPSAQPAPPEIQQLPRGAPESANEKLNEAVRKLADLKKMQ